ncbi:hypothetical protein Tco_0945620, partial [Tanacetum coccineum]
PEHPSFRARGRSLLGGDRRSFRDYPDEVGPSRSGSRPKAHQHPNIIEIEEEASALLQKLVMTSLHGWLMDNLRIMMAEEHASKDGTSKEGVNIKSARRQLLLEMEQMRMNFQRELQLQKKVSPVDINPINSSADEEGGTTVVGCENDVRTKLHLNYKRSAKALITSLVMPCKSKLIRRGVKSP